MQVEPGGVAHSFAGGPGFKPASLRLTFVFKGCGLWRHCVATLAPAIERNVKVDHVDDLGVVGVAVR